MKILHETPFLKLVENDGWGYVQRAKSTGVVAIVAGDTELILIEQFRPPLGKNVIEIPAGLVGDQFAETGFEAARRELLEETGYQALRMTYMVDLASSPGLTDEVVSFYRATGLKKVGVGGGVEDENIRVWSINRALVGDFLFARRAGGCIISAQVGIALALWPGAPTIPFGLG